MVRAQHCRVGPRRRGKNENKGEKKKDMGTNTQIYIFFDLAISFVGIDPTDQFAWVQNDYVQKGIQCSTFWNGKGLENVNTRLLNHGPSIQRVLYRYNNK